MTLLLRALNDSMIFRMTPRLLTWGGILILLEYLFDFCKGGFDTNEENLGFIADELWKIAGEP